MRLLCCFCCRSSLAFLAPTEEDHLFFLLISTPSLCEKFHLSPSQLSCYKSPLHSLFKKVIKTSSLWLDCEGAVSKSTQKDISETAGTWSLIWSMGRIPQQIISALVETKEGITRPGQSQRHRPGSTYRVCDNTCEEKEARENTHYIFLLTEKIT